MCIFYEGVEPCSPPHPDGTYRSENNNEKSNINNKKYDT